MFGIAVARLDQVSDEEKARYQALYCGLCFALKERYGQISRASLSYDLAFLVMLYDSLYEPPEMQGESHCISHPARKVPFARSIYSDLCADLSVVLAYHKCLDDVADDGSKAAKVAAGLLASSYRRAESRVPEQCAATREAMERIRAVEADPSAGPDDAARLFGDLLGFLFRTGGSLWGETLEDLGRAFGRFIYMMDAAVDYEDDMRTGSYNPFVALAAGSPPDAASLRLVLQTMIGEACAYFEKLPLVQDVHLMRSVLYSGVWQKFNALYEEGGGSCRP